MVTYEEEDTFYMVYEEEDACLHASANDKPVPLLQIYMNKIIMIQKRTEKKPAPLLQIDIKVNNSYN
jgi:hypothetical protein